MPKVVISRKMFIPKLKVENYWYIRDFFKYNGDIPKSKRDAIFKLIKKRGTETTMVFNDGIYYGYTMKISEFEIVSIHRYNRIPNTFEYEYRMMYLTGPNAIKEYEESFNNPN